METAKLRKFAQFARRSLIEQVGAKLKLVLADESPARRERPQAIKKLEEAITDQGKEQVIERVAYIWFNRFCALRFMDVNRYNRIGIVSPAEGQFQPEILADAKMGHIDEEMVSESTRQKIFALLDGKTPSQDPQGEAYRLLVVAACNYWYSAMPFLFERIDDYTELLMPDDLLSGNSILAYTREAMTPDACKDVEVIGWLYQFYISEKKDQVFADLKKNKKVTPENIPAATQLFTPHWIVRYLVENSLGRLWMLNRPNSGLIEQMDYYIKPAPAADGKEQPETDFLRISKPEEIKICDPACGSGHMLTYAFDLLYAIYEEEGVDPAEIPEKTLTNNLYGIEIDERAGELAAFALTMKARAKQRRFFSKGVKPNICVLENVHFDGNELKDYMDFVGRDLFTAPLQTTLGQFEEVDNFGSLIRPDVTDVDGMLRILESKNVSGQLFISMTHQKALQALRQADYLSPKYHVVIANPPYMNAKGMTDRTKKFAEDYYQSVKSNLFSMFMIRIQEIVRPGGDVGLMTPISWMSLSSFESLRLSLLKSTTITSFVQPEYNAFWDSAHVAVCAFTLHATPDEEYQGTFINLAGFYGADLQPTKALEAIKNESCPYRYLASGSSFKMIPGSPIAYWIKRVSNFRQRKIGEIFVSGGRNKTHNNEKYLRFVWEVDRKSSKWVSYANGGNFRKYCGNDLEFIDWSESAKNFYDSHGGLVNSKFWGKEGITWSLITSAITGFRIKYQQQQYSSGSPTIFNQDSSCDYVLLAGW
ncbi:MAG: BREX-1 system adenine-specific DNA-methyltransferase PglX [Methylohalobius sp. ZOD2]